MSFDLFGGGDQEVTQKSEPWGHLKPYLRDWVMPEALRLYQQGPMPFYPNQTFMPMTGLERMGLMNQGAFLGMNPGMFPGPGAPAGFNPVGEYQPVEGSYPPNLNSFVDPSGNQRDRQPIVPPPGSPPTSGGGGGGNDRTRQSPSTWSGPVPAHPGPRPESDLTADNAAWRRQNERWQAYQEHLARQGAASTSRAATQRVAAGQFKKGAEPAVSAYGGQAQAGGWGLSPFRGGMMGGGPAQAAAWGGAPTQAAATKRPGDPMVSAYGGGRQSRFGGGGMFGGVSGAAGISPAQALVNQTMGTSANLMGAPDVGRNPWVQGAIDAGTNRMTKAFSENVLPELSRLALGRGMTGSSGHTEGVLRGAEDLLQNIGDFQKGYMGDAYGRGLGAAGEAVRLSPQTFRMGLAPGAAMQDIGGQFRGEGQRYLDEDMRRYDWGYNAQNQHLNNLIAGLNPGLRFQSSSTSQPGAPLAPQLLGSALMASALPWSSIGKLFGGGGGGVMPPMPWSGVTGQFTTPFGGQYGG